MRWLDHHRRDVSVVVTSRQWGKTTFALLYCLAYCIRHPKHSVLYLAPFLAQLKNYMLPKLNFVMQFLPEDLTPAKRGLTWTFPNGSIFRLDGVAIGAASRLRGDVAHLVVMDEVRDIHQLQSVIESSLSPMFTTTSNTEWGGRLIMISTPPDSPMHDFTNIYINEALRRGDLFKMTYMDNPLLSTKRLKVILETQYKGGVENYAFQREYNANWHLVAPDKLVVREWNPTMNDEYFRTYSGPPNPVRMYTTIDYGYSDPCAILCGYLDYNDGCLILTHEHIARKMTTAEVGLKVMELEAELRKHLLPGALKDVIRISDIDPGFQQDLFTQFGLRSEPVFKLPSVLTMINRLRVSFLQGKIRIHPRMVETRFQLSAGIFTPKMGSTEYQRTTRGGHLDAIAALKYLNLNCRWSEILRPKEFEGLLPGHMRVGGFARADTFKSGILNRPI